MGCGCGSKSKNRAKAAGQRYELVMPTGKTLPNGETRKVYETWGEAVAARRAVGAGTVKRA